MLTCPLRLALASTVATLLALPCAAPVAEDSPYTGYISLGGKFGSSRNIGEAQLFIPVSQDDENLLFADIRLKTDSLDSREGNFGLGYRRRLNNRTILGGYGFLDMRRTAYGNHFTQATLGAEALTAEQDLRFNLYLPEQDSKLATSSVSLQQTGTQLVFRQQQAYEKGSPGADIEIGHLVPIPYLDLRAYAGAYHFLQDGDDMTGLRARLRWQSSPVDIAGQPVTFRLNAEAQHDNIRGGNAYIGGELLMPLGPAGVAPPTDALRARMTESVVRDVDIVTSLRQAAPQVEAAKTSVAGSTLEEVHILPGSAMADLNTSLAALPENTAIIIDGASPVTLNTPLTPRSGQTLLASETPLTLTTSFGPPIQLTSGNSRAQLVKASSIPSATALINLGAGSNIRLVNMDLLTESGLRGDDIVMISNNGNPIGSLTLTNVNSDGAIVLDTSSGNTEVRINGGEYYGGIFRARGTAEMDVAIDNSTFNRHYTRSEVFNTNLSGMAVFEAMNNARLTVSSLTNNTFTDSLPNTAGRVALGVAFINSGASTLNASNVINNTVSRTTGVWEAGAILGQGAGGGIVNFNTMHGNSAAPFEAVNVRININRPGAVADEAGFEASNPGTDIINYGNTTYTNTP